MDKNNEQFVTYDKMITFFNDSNIMTDAELKTMFNSMDLNGDGKISIKEFKYNLKKQLKTHSTIEDDEDQEVEIEKTREIVSQEYLEFKCTKEPRHEFFSSLKVKERVFRFFKDKMT